MNGLAQRHHVLYGMGKVEDARAVAKTTLEAAKASAARDTSIASRQDELAQAHRRVADHAYFQFRKTGDRWLIVGEYAD